MSMETWSVNGIGVDADAIDGANTDKKIKFIKKHLPHIYSEMESSGENYEDWINNYEDCDCNRGFSVLFADAINWEHEDIRFDCCKFEEEGAVMLTERLPWQYSEAEKKLTRDKIDEILKKYLQEIDVKAGLEFQTVLYYG